MKFLEQWRSVQLCILHQLQLQLTANFIVNTDTCSVSRTIIVDSFPVADFGFDSINKCDLTAIDIDIGSGYIEYYWSPGIYTNGWDNYNWTGCVSDFQNHQLWDSSLTNQFRTISSSGTYYKSKSPLTV